MPFRRGDAKGKAAVFKAIDDGVEVALRRGKLGRGHVDADPGIQAATCGADLLRQGPEFPGEVDAGLGAVKGRVALGDRRGWLSDEAGTDCDGECQGLSDSGLSFHPGFLS